MFGADIVYIGGPAPAAGQRALLVSGTIAGGSITATPPTTSTATATRVATSIVSVTIRAAAPASLGGTVWNGATTNLYLRLGTPAIITPGSERFSVKLVPGAYYEIPFGWIGVITGIWDGADAAGYAAVEDLAA